MTCIKDEVTCRRDCTTIDQGVMSKPFKVEATNVGVCEKNCGIDFGKCLITTGDFKTCLKEQASCALDCLKSVSASKGVAQSQDVGVCEKNCAIDYSKCLILTFDMLTCSQQQAACALDCLKSVTAAPTNKCDVCISRVTTASQLISDLDCNLTKAQIKDACMKIGAETTAAFQTKCNAAFPKYCPTLKRMIKEKNFEPAKVCKSMGRCQ